MRLLHLLSGILGFFTIGNVLLAFVTTAIALGLPQGLARDNGCTFAAYCVILAVIHGIGWIVVESGKSVIEANRE